MYGYLFCLKISPCTQLLKHVFLLILGKSQNFWKYVGKISSEMRNLAIKMMKNTCLYSYSSLYFYSFLEKKPPPILLFKPVRVLETAEYVQSFGYTVFQKTYALILCSL